MPGIPGGPNGLAVTARYAVANSMSVITIILVCQAVYAGIGLVFAFSFAVLGIGRLDPVARHASPGVRLLIVPGAAALWPLVLRRWLAKARQKA